MASVTNESRLEERHMQEEHHSGVARYVMVFVALVVFTLLTVWTGRMDIPAPWHLVVALGIATTKASLVALFFMHLVDHKGFNRLIFAVSILFVLLLMFFPMADIGTRTRFTNPPGSTQSDLQVIDPVINADGRFGGALKPSEAQDK